MFKIMITLSISLLASSVLHAATEEKMFWSCVSEQGNQKFAIQLWEEPSSLIKGSLTYVQAGQTAFQDQALAIDFRCRFTEQQKGSCVSTNFKRWIDVQPKSDHLVQLDMTSQDIIWPGEFQNTQKNGSFTYTVDLNNPNTKCGFPSIQ